uniref:Glycoprotein hormone subunit beta domain-containing protein n=1 Tax=Varanus komodoensis TaxID=61221 RepID=A0A8D2IZK8_VARKO
MSYTPTRRYRKRLSALFILHSHPFLATLQSWGTCNLACHPVNATIAAEKEDCPVCMAITTSICSGYCETRCIPKYRRRVCTYKDVRYETMLLRGCPAGVDPSFTYPVALSCHCDLCKMDSSDCTVQKTNSALGEAEVGFSSVIR